MSLEKIWSCSIQKINKNSSRRTPRRNFNHQIGKIQKKKVENDENSNFDKFGCRGRSASGSGAKHI